MPCLVCLAENGLRPPGGPATRGAGGSARAPLAAHWRSGALLPHMRVAVGPPFHGLHGAFGLGRLPGCCCPAPLSPRSRPRERENAKLSSMLGGDRARRGRETIALHLLLPSRFTGRMVWSLTAFVRLRRFCRRRRGRDRFPATVAVAVAGRLSPRAAVALGECCARS